MQYWPFWIGALALGAVPLVHWLLLRRTLAVSGRFTALVDRLRHRDEPEPDAMSLDEMAEALREMVASEYGVDALETPSCGDDVPVADLRPPQTPKQHLAFFGALVLGGSISSLLAGSFGLTPTLHSSVFAEIAKGPVGSAVMLLGGGVLVGFGTRMAGGCTSGHGLCGVSRFQPGSFVATAAFFGMGVVTSFLLGGLR